MQNPSDLDGAPLELLIKLAKMTASDNDNLALVAARKMNAQLLKMGTDWEALLRGKVKIIADPFTNINIPEGAMSRNFNRSTPYTPAPPPPPDTSAPMGAHPTFRTYKKAPPPPPPPYTPPPPPQPDKLEVTIVNKHDGTCTRCKGRVLAGHGKAKKFTRANGTFYWTTEHDPCPTSKPASRKATTTDDLQF